MIRERSVHRHHAAPLLYQPLSRVLGQAGGLAVVLQGIRVLVVPAGIDDHNIALAHGPRLFQILGGDGLIAALGHIQHHTVAEEAVRGDGGQVRAALDQVDRGQHVRTGVQGGTGLPCQHAVLCVLH